MNNLEKIVEALSKHIAIDILKESDRIIEEDELLISSGLIDSFSLVDLALLVEDLFNIRIDDSELNSETFDTISELALIINQRLQSL